MRLSALAVLILTGCATTQIPSTARIPSQPVNVVISHSSMGQSDTDLFRKVTQLYVGKVRTAQPLTLSVTVIPASYAMLADGYWDIEAPEFTSGHAVPLVGGSTYAEVGFLPTVGGSTIGAGPGLVRSGSWQWVGGGSYIASYVITTSSGKVLESRTLPLSSALQDFHTTGVYLAKRVAKAN